MGDRNFSTYQLLSPCNRVRGVRVLRYPPVRLIFQRRFLLPKWLYIRGESILSKATRLCAVQPCPTGAQEALEFRHRAKSLEVQLLWIPRGQRGCCLQAGKTTREGCVTW